MRDRLIELIRNAPKTDTVYGDIKLAKPAQTLQTIADHLLANGVIVPPVKLGQTVYAVLFEGDDAEIWPWSVCGFAFMEGKWYAVERDGSEWEVGGACCHLSEEAAEQYKQREMEKRTVTGPCKEERENAEVTDEAD